ncbi:hypothetical protein R6Q57_024484 [Mikania cordata]
MAAGFLLVLMVILSSSTSTHALTRGSSLLVENKDDQLILSPNALFTAGFHQVGQNAYVFAVWFTSPITLVWMANRDAPVNGHSSKLSLSKDGNLVLIDAGQYIIWSTQTESKSSSLQLKLHNSGNLVLQQEDQQILWQTFDHPTDTLLPNQPLTRNTQLVSSRSSSNCSSGFYKLFFDNDSILRLLYSSPETTSIYWPDPRVRTYSIGRFQYIDKRRATLDSYGQFNSTDGFSFVSADFGAPRFRMMRLDTDGNVRVYSLVRGGSMMKWEVQCQAITEICRIDGTCGPNSLCSYTRDSGRKCSCLHGFKMVNSQDWSYGCEPEFQMCKNSSDCDFIVLEYAEFYGYDISFHPNTSLDACKKDCLQDKTCRGFNFAWKTDGGYYFCFLKSSLHNGYQMGVYGTMYIKLPKRLVSSFNGIGQSSLSCPVVTPPNPLIRSYEKRNDTKPLGFMLATGCVIGLIEIMCIVFFWYRSSKTSRQNYIPASTGFRKFTYRELKQASRNFSEEIGRGGASVVYKARLKDKRIAAVKRLNNNEQGEDEFQAEISSIGRMNHMNLIQTWGYCAQGNHRLIVYEYMENGSLANNLVALDWAARFNIVTGTAKGLAYLHEECLEWILHCDVKPHNILLDANYNPKVADFGLSKRSDRGIGSGDQWKFSMMRGTRGYMAPEWVLNLPITSKVDVYSYGVVILELITGRSPGDGNLINWVRDQTQTQSQSQCWLEGIIDPSIKASAEYDDGMMMENVVRIALQCTEEDSEARPTMSQVLNMLQLCI